MDDFRMACDGAHFHHGIRTGIDACKRNLLRLHGVDTKVKHYSYNN